MAKLGEKRQTPHWAILAGGVVGIAAIYSDNLLSFGGQPLTANIVTMSVLGALTMYILCMAALFRLRRKEPGLHRPFRAPLYPYLPALAIGLAAISLMAVIYYNALVSALFAGLFVVALPLYRRGTLAATRNAANSANPSNEPVKAPTAFQPPELQNQPPAEPTMLEPR